MAAVIVPFVEDMLHEDTLAAVQASGVQYSLWQIDPTDEHAYPRLFATLWERAETFVILEHDVVPTVEQLWTIIGCDHDWCSFPYGDYNQHVGPVFGLVRFDRRIMEAHPHLPKSAVHVGSDHPRPVYWWNVDNRVARDLQIRHVPHVFHTPPVLHDHRGEPTKARIHD